MDKKGLYYLLGCLFSLMSFVCLVLYIPLYPASLLTIIIVAILHVVFYVVGVVLLKKSGVSNKWLVIMTVLVVFVDRSVFQLVWFSIGF